MNTVPPLSYLVYVSTATWLFTDEELLSLLRECRENNARNGITGMLLYSDGNFIQVVEGPDEAITTLEAKILSDPRHNGIIRLVQGHVESRLFHDWAMAFKHGKNFTPEESAEVSDFLRTMYVVEEDRTDAHPSAIHPALKLLLDFRQFMSP